MRLFSIWEKDILEAKKDIIIIGAGIVGLKTAIEIKKAQPKWKILVVERDIFGSAASSKNAGFACFGSVSEIIADISKYGKTSTLEIIQMRRRGLEELKNDYCARIQLSFLGGWELFRNHHDYEKTADQLDSINKLIEESIFQTRDLPFRSHLYQKGIFNPFEGQLNTGLFYEMLCSQAQSLDISIVRGCSVKQIDAEFGTIVSIIDDQEVEMKADQIVVATNALTYQLLDNLNVVPVLNQVIVTHPIPQLSINGTFHMDEGYIYFRNLDNRILIGGGRHLFEHKAHNDYLIEPHIQEYLLHLLTHDILPGHTNVTIEQSWSGILSGGNYRLPIVKRISEKVVVGARLGGMGVAIGLEVGKEVATHITE